MSKQISDLPGLGKIVGVVLKFVQWLDERHLKKLERAVKVFGLAKNNECSVDLKHYGVFEANGSFQVEADEPDNAPCCSQAHSRTATTLPTISLKSN